MNYKFYPEYDTVKNHILRSNPHKPGSPRDALTNGVGCVEDYLWTEEVELPLDVFSNLNLEYGLNKRNLAKYQKQIRAGSMPPAVIAIMKENLSLSLVDGCHRVTALKKEGFNSVKVYIGILPEILAVVNI